MNQRDNNSKANLKFQIYEYEIINHNRKYQKNLISSTHQYFKYVNYIKLHDY